LGGGDEIGLACAQPGQEPHGNVGLVADDRVPALSELTGLREARHPRAVMPAQVGGDEPAVGGLGHAGHATFGPPLIGGEITVALGQDAVGDEQLSQVLAPVGHHQGVEAVMAERDLSGGEGTDARAGVLPAEPRQPAPRDLHGGQGIDEGHEHRIDLSGSVVEEPVETSP
jgi:hypothetical protein